MKSIQIEVSEEQYDAFQRLQEEEQWGSSEFFTLLVILFMEMKSPESMDAKWDRIRRAFPDTDRWNELRTLIDHLHLPIRQTEGIMGGTPCIGNTRIPVWALVALKKQGMTDGELLRAYPSLEASDLESAWSYYTVQSAFIDAEIANQNEEREVG